MRRGHDALTHALTLALPLALALLVGSCSTIADEPPPECEDDQDCGDGLICSIAQGSICVPEELPPRTALGFVIQEGDLRLELRGCDPEVSLESGGNELRIRSRDRIVREFELSTSLVRDVDFCEACTETGYTCDPVASTCQGPIDSKISLAQNSRFAVELPPSPSEEYVIPVDPPLPEGELPPPVGMVWPHYDSTEAAAHWATRLDVGPIMEGDGLRGTVHRVIADGVEGSLDLVSTLRCHRGLVGGEGTVRQYQGGAVVDAKIEFSYDEPIATASTVVGASSTPCSQAAPCPLGWACGDSGTCALDLTGVSIGSVTSIAAPAGGTTTTYLYTYCEGVESPADDPFTIALLARVTPPFETGLPQVSFRIDQPFPDPASPDASRTQPMTEVLCLPPWLPPHPIEFSVVGEPVELADTELGTYRCCSTDCLPTQSDVEPTPPPNVESCTGFESAVFSTSWFLRDATPWGNNGCTQPATNSEGANGRYRREVTPADCGDAPCSVELTHGELDEIGRTYAVELLQPKGSVFRSRALQVEVDADTVDFGGPFELEPRVLLRGRVVCAEGSENCNFANAAIAVERLRVATDEPDPLGPFFFEGTSDAEGNFLLPVEPGVYVITGYPAIGQPGGPSRFEILDLRSDSSLVTTIAGVPNAILAEPIELDDGLLVRALLKDFDVNTRVTPYDLGSWTSDPAFEGFDLNAPETCYNDSLRRGCLIRQLRPTNASISLLLSGRFQFTARSVGSSQCGP